MVMKAKPSRNKILYILDDGKDQYSFDTELDMLNYLSNVRELLIENNNNNMIYCIENIKPIKYKGLKYKMYMLINEQYYTKEKVASAVISYRKKGFNAYPIL
jgi:hypothetical protein